MLESWAIHVTICNHPTSQWTWLVHSYDGSLFGVNDEGHFRRFMMRHNHLTHVTKINSHLVLREIIEPIE